MKSRGPWSVFSIALYLGFWDSLSLFLKLRSFIFSAEVTGAHYHTWFFRRCWRSTLRFCLCGRYLLAKPSSKAQIWILLLSYMLESKTRLPPLKVLLSWEWLLFLYCWTYNGPLYMSLYIFLLLKVRVCKKAVFEREYRSFSHRSVHFPPFFFFSPLTPCASVPCTVLYFTAVLRGRIQIWDWNIEKKEIFAG